ncbi:hypothetical protein GTR00_03310, partial [Kineococcus sp. T90]
MSPRPRSRPRAPRHEVLEALDPLLAQHPAQDAGQHPAGRTAAARAEQPSPEQPSPEQVHRAHERLLALALAHPRGAGEVGVAPAGENALHRDASVRPARGRRGWRPRRWIAAGTTGLALGAAVALGAVVLPGVPGGSPQAAFASWTAVPAALAVADVPAAGQACKDRNPGQDTAASPLLPTGAQIQAMGTVLAERRGAYTYTLLAGGGWLAECLSG